MTFVARRSMDHYDSDSSLKLADDSRHELSVGARSASDSRLRFEEESWSFDPTDSMSVEVLISNEAGELLDTQLFDQPFVLIGRSPDCDLTLQDEEVSFRHAYLQRIFGRVLCVDLASRTGTIWPNGPRPFGWFDEHHPITIGPYRLKLGASSRDERPAEPEMDTSAFFRTHSSRSVLPTVTLQYLSHSGPGETWTLHRPITLVGSSSRCKLRLRHESVSRVHCSLLLMPDGLWVVDLLGKDGTCVDDQPVRYARVRDGSTLKLGRYTFRVAYEQRTERAVASTAPTPALPTISTGISEDFVGRLVEQMTQMQMQFLEHSRQQTEMMLQFFGTLHNNQHQLLREEMARVGDINRELRELKALIAQPAPPASAPVDEAPVPPLRLLSSHDDPEPPAAGPVIDEHSLAIGEPTPFDGLRQQLEELRAAVERSTSAPRPKRRRPRPPVETPPLATPPAVAEFVTEPAAVLEPSPVEPANLEDTFVAQPTAESDTAPLETIKLRETTDESSGWEARDSAPEPTSIVHDAALDPAADAETDDPSKGVDQDDLGDEAPESPASDVADPHAWVLQRMEKLERERQGILRRMFRSIFHSES